MSIVDEILALGSKSSSVEKPARENYTVARPNSDRLLEMLGDYLDGKTLAEELINWMSDDEVGRFAEENGYFPDEPEKDSGELEAEEGVVNPELFEVRFDEDANNLNGVFSDKEKALAYAKENINEGPAVYFIDENGNESLIWAVGDEEFSDELTPEQPVGDSQALDEKEGKPVKSATEKKSICEEYDEMEKEMFEAMNRNSITDFQASVSDSISRIGSLGTIQLLLDSELADSFQDELFFIKNTYDLSDTQLVSQAILDAGETLLEDGELEMAIETLKNTSEENSGEDEFGEYEEPDDWSEVDQVEEGEPSEGEEVIEEETDFKEENI